MGVLENIGHWDASTIYIEPLPSGIGTLVANLFKQFQSSVSENQQIQSAYDSLLAQLIGSGSLGTGLPGSTSGGTGNTPTTPGGTPGAGTGTHLQGIGKNDNPTPGAPGANPGTPKGTPGKPRKGSNGRLQDAIDVAEVFWANDWNFGLCDPAARRARIKYGSTLSGDDADTWDSSGNGGPPWNKDHKNRNCGGYVHIQKSAADSHSWPVFCRTVIHEYGHLLKWHHSDAKGACSIMNHVPTSCSIPSLAKRPQGSVKP